MIDHKDDDNFDKEPHERNDEREFSTRSISDWLKKTLVTGASAEPLISMLAQADKTRREVTHILARELRGFLSGIEVQDMLLKILSNATLEVNAKIRLIPSKDGGMHVKIIRDDENEPVKAQRSARAKSAKKKKKAKKPTDG